MDKCSWKRSLQRRINRCDGEEIRIAVNNKYQARADKQPFKKWIRLGYFETVRSCRQSKYLKRSFRNQTYLILTDKGMNYFKG